MNKTLSLSLTGLALAVSFSSGTRLALAKRTNLSDIQSDAVEMYQAGRYEAAIPLYRQIAAAQPKNSGALKDFLVSLSLADHAPEAATVAARLVRLTPNDIEVHFMYARALLLTGNKEAAQAEIQRCRELDPNEQHIQLAEARLEGMLHEYEEAIAHMESLAKAYPDYHDVYAELGRLQSTVGEYSKASKNWSSAVKYFPQNRGYLYHEAEALYFSGSPDEGLKKMQVLVSTEPIYGPAIDFLTDTYIAQGDYHKAKALLKLQLQNPKIGDEGLLLKQILMSKKEQRWGEMIENADQWLTLDPKSSTAMKFKAEAYKNQGHYTKAIALYETILRENPSGISTWRSLALVQDLNEHPEFALEAIQKAITLDPTDPYLLIYQAYYQYEAGDRTLPKSSLKQWIADHPEPALPVLLYHGVTPYAHDPILAYSHHQSTSTLDDHLKTLHEAGYTAVTAEQVNAWIKGQSSLPERPILITFDDARLDSIRSSDPLLKKYGMKATMFAPLVNVDEYLPKYASWRELTTSYKTGRWEIQSHGDHAHERILIDESGRRGLFLLNKAWQSDKHRLESDEEWHTRACGDYEKSQRKIKNRLGYEPKVYAFPEGNYGQEENSNSPTATAVNLQCVAKTYTTAYHEDDFGFNVRSRDPMHLTRYEPAQDETGKSLLRHLTDQAPATLMVRRLLREAAWERRAHEADYWLEELKKRGVSSSTLQVEEARIRFGMGDLQGARTLAENALREDNSLENQDLVRELSKATRSYWNGKFTYEEDNHSRISRRFRQDLGYWHTHGFDWTLHHLFGSYSESDVPSVTDHGGGIGVAHNVGDSHRVSLDVTGHALSATAKNTFTLLAALHSTWGAYWSTDLEGGRDVYHSARALDANIINNYVTAQGQWHPTVDWQALARTRFEHLSDHNSRVTGIVEGGHRVLFPNFWIMARATLEDTEHLSLNYYSPQLLQIYQVGPNYTYYFSRESTLNIAYMPGYGKEKASSGEFVNDIDVTLNLQLTPSLSFTPSAFFIRQPTYHRNTYSASLTYRF